MVTPGAAVVGSSIVSFMSSVPQQQRESVMLGLLMAELRADQDVSEGLNADWLGTYRNQLRYLGWDAVSPEQVHWPDTQRERSLDQALQAIGRAAGERHVELMQLAYAGLRDAPPALLQFENLVRERGSFRLLPCAPAAGGRVEMVLYHEQVSEQHLSAGFLFHQRQHIRVDAQLVRFNVRLFEQSYRAKVVNALGTAQYKHIREFSLPRNA